MKRRKNFNQVLLCIFIMMFTMIVGCSSSDNTAIYTISGTAKVDDGDVFANVTINLTGAATASTTTDSSGNFSFTDLANGIYTVIPSYTEYTFSPVSTVIVVDGADISNTNFVATSTGGTDTYSISGTITGAVQYDVKITLSGTGQTGTAKTKTDGTYIFENLVDGHDYTVTPSLSGYTFDPTSANVTISAANVTTDFTATAQ